MKTIHETVIRDVIDIVQTVSDDDVIQGLMNRNKSFRSPTSAASNLILTFPVIITNAIPIDIATLITKATERKAVSLMRILFSAIAIDNAKDAISFVKKYHTNLSSDSMTLDDYIELLDKTVLDEGVDISGTDYEKVRDDLKRISHVLPDDINEYSLNEYYVSNIYGNQKVFKEDIYDGDSLSDRKNMFDIERYRVLDNDIKKANEVMPTLMTINLISSSFDDPVSLGNIVIGIKAKLYYINSEDAINRIIVKNNDKQGLFKFIKASTREISFWKDFVFMVDRAKIDALSKSNRGSSSALWKILERRAIKSKIRRSLGQSNDASAISTLCISMTEVETIKREANINLLKSKDARYLLDAYNLMGFVIVDEVLETARFLYDTGDDEYEVISFSSLEKESSDNTYKKVMNLMTKMR